MVFSAAAAGGALAAAALCSSKTSTPVHITLNTPPFFLVYFYESVERKSYQGKSHLLHGLSTTLLLPLDTLPQMRLDPS